MDKSVKKPMQVTERVLHIWNTMNKTVDCRLCKVLLHKGDQTFLLMNNYTLFPNCFVHQACWSDLTDEVLSTNWEEAQLYKGWFSMR